jgi:hypothetical protein
VTPSLVKRQANDARDHVQRCVGLLYSDPDFPLACSTIYQLVNGRLMGVTLDAVETEVRYLVAEDS